MGSACTSCQSEMEFEQIDLKISKKTCAKISKLTNIAAAKREANKLKLGCIKQITGKFLSVFYLLDLKYPCYKANEGQTISFSGKPLMTDEEVSSF